MIPMRGNVTNIEAVAMALRTEHKRRRRKVEKALVRGGLLLQRESQKIVPIDTGALKNSARTRKTASTKDMVEVSVSYNTAYAIFVHENLEARHAPGKSAKYLEIPFRRFGNQIATEVRAAMK